RIAVNQRGRNGASLLGFLACLPSDFSAHLQTQKKPPGPLRTWGNRLLAFTPGATRSLVAVPRAAVLGELLKRDLVHLTVGTLVLCWLCGALGWWLRWWLRCRILLEERSQPGQEPRFIGVT